MSYDRAAIAAPRRRIKEWDYYCVLTERFGVALTAADNGYMGLLSASVLDLAKGDHVTESYVSLLPLGRFGMPASSVAGDVRVRHPKGFVDFAVLDSGSRVLKVDFPAFAKGTGLRGALVLTESEGAESIVMSTAWRKNRRAFYYNRKVNCLAAEGVMQFGDHELMFSKGAAFGVLDWGRGVWPYRSNWYWASASTELEGIPFGFNLGYGFGDPNWATENAIFYAGRVHKFGSIVFRIDPRDSLAPWRFESGDGRFHAVLRPSFDRAASMNAIAVSSVQHQVFGYFSGWAVLDDGRKLEFSELPGFAEKVKNRW